MLPSAIEIHTAQLFIQLYIGFRYRPLLGDGATVDIAL